MTSAKAIDEEILGESAVKTNDEQLDAPAGVQAPKALGPYLINVQRSRKEQFAAWYGTAVMFFVVLVPTLNSTILAYFTKQLKADCGLTIAQYGLLSGYANGLVYACSAVGLGWAVDRLNWPRTYVMAAAYLLLAGMYVLEGMATNFGQLFAAVMVAAIGSSTHLTLSVSLVSDLLPPEQVSIGQALIFTGEAVAVVLGGNLAFAFNEAGISWRAAPLGLAVAAGVLALTIALTIREPPKGRFIAKAEGTQARKFGLGAALAYLANMRIFWLMVIGLGIRSNAGHLILAFMPPYQQLLYPNQSSLNATFATVVGVCAFLSSLIIGGLCEHQVKKKRPWMALYTAAYGGMAGCVFFMISLWSKKIAGEGGYALMLVCMGLGALLANGATGPLAALATLVLPPELKSFALSLYEFLTGLLAPSYSVIMGVGLQAVATKATREVSNDVIGVGPSTALEAASKTFEAARIFLAIGLLFSFYGAAGFFLGASWGVLPDIKKVHDREQGNLPAEKVTLLRKIVMTSAVVLLILFVLLLLVISIIASFAPGSVRGHHG